MKPNREQITKEIERLIDHHIPYRPVTDSAEAREVRKVLSELLNFITEDRK